MTTHADTSTQLHPPWLNIARGLWVVLTAAALLVSLASTVISLREPLPSCVNPSTACGPWSLTREDLLLAQQSGFPASLLLIAYFASSLIPKVAFVAVGLVIFIRRSDDWIALLLSLMLTTFLLEGIQNLGPLMPLVNALYAVPTVIFIALPFIFPNGRFVPRWMTWPAAAILVLTLIATFLPQLSQGVSNTLYSGFLLSAFLLWFVAAGYSAVYRYRRVSSAAERQQTKWVVAGILGFFLLFVPFTIITIWFPPETPTVGRMAFMLLVFMPVYMVSYLALPAGVAFAILRYRLWDIDVLVRKTLVYASLTVLLALVFFGVVTLMSSLFSAVSGQQSALAIVVSTLVIAALFNPLRRRLQEGIDRRFFRRKYDAQQVLARFALTARDETDLDALTAELVGVVQETMQPSHVSIWLRK
ncbi:MAG: hypothetical protein KDI07_07380 [Anaerolineae bacterium]|nr:hypothetical protein [Anaerolineae bacterium]MCB9129635.1 hypothetical protein [Anaerolineales bacterium]MCB0228024.1 hypothetical protein [Anaerolineae bacterium]MCB0235708.1 hypothetical protein [Anaerolineae bacterium]MCB0248385.1 hypothetical protein [Anaerolineae bacterium]